MALRCYYILELEGKTSYQWHKLMYPHTQKSWKCRTILFLVKIAATVLFTDVTNLYLIWNREENTLQKKVTNVLWTWIITLLFGAGANNWGTSQNVHIWEGC